MAITVTALAGAGDTANTTSHTTASQTPSANKLILGFVQTSVASAPTSTLSGNGLTWDEVGNVLHSNGFRRMTVFRAMGTPSAGAVTITHAISTTGCNWSFMELDGIDTSGTNGSGAIVANSFTSDGPTGTVTSASLTMPALGASDNVTVAGFSITDVGAITQTWSATEVHEVSYSAPATALETDYKVPGSTTLSWSWSVAALWMAAGVEIKAGAAAEPPTWHKIVPMRRTHG